MSVGFSFSSKEKVLLFDGFENPMVWVTLPSVAGRLRPSSDEKLFSLSKTNLLLMMIRLPKSTFVMILSLLWLAVNPITMEDPLIMTGFWIFESNAYVRMSVLSSGNAERIS